MVQVRVHTSRIQGMATLLQIQQPTWTNWCNWKKAAAGRFRTPHI